MSGHSLFLLSTSSFITYYIDSKELQECIDWEKEIQNHAKNDHSRLFLESKECINLEKEGNITFKKIEDT
ncbi:10397_t:CDS:2 [Diversispora eburnea]|uniref:10397_t:CDS:1 n=1 Tax=Diversispora eburnea TaxID=1213867 RepID=A0A9N9AMN1_9GLOM|nr:10397_t:CDS:2 [Diversispora eburnea]